MSNKKWLRIEISGSTGTGKTSLAIAIADFLRKFGFEIIIKDYDIAYEDVPENLWSLAIATLPDRTNIFIETINLRKEWTKTQLNKRQSVIKNVEWK